MSDRGAEGCDLLDLHNQSYIHRCRDQCHVAAYTYVCMHTPHMTSIMHTCIYTGFHWAGGRGKIIGGGGGGEWGGEGVRMIAHLLVGSGSMLAHKT